MQGYRVDQEDAHLMVRIRGGDGRYGINTCSTMTMLAYGVKLPSFSQA